MVQPAAVRKGFTIIGTGNYFTYHGNSKLLRVRTYRGLYMKDVGSLYV
jgi:hypothetical protein